MTLTMLVDGMVVKEDGQGRRLCFETAAKLFAEPPGPGRYIFVANKDREGWGRGMR